MCTENTAILILLSFVALHVWGEGGKYHQGFDFISIYLITYGSCFPLSPLQ